MQNQTQDCILSFFVNKFENNMCKIMKITKNI